MANKTDKKIDLVINQMESEAQLESLQAAGQLEPNQLYMTPDDPIQISVEWGEITGDINSNTALTDELNKKISKQNIDVVQDLDINVNNDVVTMTKKTINLNDSTLTPTSQQKTIIQDATQDRSGLMTSTDKKALDQAISDISNLKGQTTRLLYTTSTTPTAVDINNFVVGQGYTSPFSGIAVVVDQTFHIWHYYVNESTWKDDGPDTVSNFTNDNAGVIKGSTENGKVYANADGTGSVNGFDTLKSQVETNTSSINTNTTNIIKNSNDIVTANEAISTLSSSKQDILISGTNIKTINNESILGSGNIEIQGGSGGDYVAGNGINITDNTISADTNVLATKDDIPTGEVDVTFNGTATETMENLNNIVIGDTTYTISEPYNPNLLLNDEMKINQRDKSVYYGENAYGTDRWLCVDESAFMRLNSSSQWAIGLEDTDSAGERIAIKQIIEDYQSLKGQTVTLTLSYNNLTEGVLGTTQLALYDGVKTETVALTSSGTAILTTTISSNADRVEVRIKTSATGTDTSLVFKYCKLELGGSSTPLVPKNTGLALTECQRYYQKLSTFGCSNIPTTVTSFDAPINLLTSLRTTPTLKLSANPLIVGNGNSISSTSYSISSLKNNKAIINLQSTQSMTLNQVYVLSDVTAEFDAEMY